MMTDPLAPVTLPVARLTPRFRMTFALIGAVVVLAFITVGYAVRSLADSSTGWKEVAEDTRRENAALRDQLETVNDEQACRSRASFDTLRGLASVTEIIAKQVVANTQGPGAPSGPPGSLPEAIAALDAAIVAQDAAIPRDPTAVSTCSKTEPTVPP